MRSQFLVANGNTYELQMYNIRYGTSVIRFGRLASPKSLGRSLQNHDKLQSVDCISERTLVFA
jgi:hypothetical protein